MHDLWGGEQHHIAPAQRTKRPKPSRASVPVTLTVAQCRCFSHAWQVIGLPGEKRCTACGAKGACPRWVASPLPANVYLVYCTQHMPQREVLQP
jgi:hypothetical protein